MNYLPLKDYELIAKKILKASFPKIATLFLKDNDKFGEVVSAIVTADWKWDGRGTLVGYRKQRVSWCVKSILSKDKKKPASLNFNITDSMELLDTIPDEEEHDYTEYDDKLSYLRKRVNKSLILTEREKQCMSLYFSNKELAFISNDLGITKECVKSSIRKGLAKMGKIE